MISILIPTLNRSEFIERSLRYYFSVGFSECIYIGDSSNDLHRQKNENNISKYIAKLNIKYDYFPQNDYPNEGLCLKEMGMRANTPYVVFSGDDDFLVPNTLKKCTAFLETYQDFGAVNGISLWVRLDNDHVQGQVVEAGYVGAHRLTSSQASERWIGYCRQSISTQYYVHRKEIWQQAYEYMNMVPVKYLGPEFMPCSLTAIAGKITEIEGLATVFQQRNNKNFGWHVSSMYHLMLDPRWSVAVANLKKAISNAISSHDNIHLEESNKIFDREFWRHMIFMLSWHYMLHHDEPLNPYDKLKRNKALVNFYNRIRQIRAGKSHREISLINLLQPNHQLYGDFLPIYNCLIGD
jgi:glycosyltransferase domain-containing protein